MPKVNLNYWYVSGGASVVLLPLVAWLLTKYGGVNKSTLAAVIIFSLVQILATSYYVSHSDSHTNFKVLIILMCLYLLVSSSLGLAVHNKCCDSDEEKKKVQGEAGWMGTQVILAVIIIAVLLSGKKHSGITFIKATS